MAFDKTNTGTLSRNTEKDAEHPTWADYKGTLNWEGTEYYLSAWIKDGPERKFLSLSWKPKDAPKAKPAPKRIDPDIGPEPETDDIPF